MSDLEINFLGKQLCSPFWIGSGAYQTFGSFIERWVDVLVENHWSGIVTKSYLGTTPLQAWPSCYLWTTPFYRSMMMQNIGPPPVPLKKSEVRGLKKSTKRCHENRIVVIGNIIGRTTSEWITMAEMMEEAGCDAIELNFGCPASPIKGHPTLQERYENFLEVIEAVKGHVDVPVLSKINAQILDRVKMAKDCKRAGSDAITAINTVGGIIGIDVDTGVPICSDTHQVGVMSGLSGPLIKPIGLRVVAEIASNVDIPICGVGGISHWRDAVEYIMVGASVIQVCTAVMWKGFSVGKRMYEGLQKFMRDKGYQNVSEIRGISLPYFAREPVPMKRKPHAYIDQALCSRCGACHVACREGAFDAIRRIRGTYKVNQRVCDGCGLCRVVCPQGAMEIKAI